LRSIDVHGLSGDAEPRATTGTVPRKRPVSARSCAAPRQLGNRLVGILDGCLITNTAYDEEKVWNHPQEDLVPAA
jgi:hypothetical protein